VRFDAHNSVVKFVVRYCSQRTLIPRFMFMNTHDASINHSLTQMPWFRNTAAFLIAIFRLEIICVSFTSCVLCGSPAAYSMSAIKRTIYRFIRTNETSALRISKHRLSKWWLMNTGKLFKYSAQLVVGLIFHWTCWVPQLHVGCVRYAVKGQNQSQNVERFFDLSFSFCNNPYSYMVCIVS